MPTSDRDSDSAHLLGLGVNRELERRLRDRWGMKYAVAMPSGTTALLAVGLALDVCGCTFVTTPLTFGATVGSWLALGAQPHFADVDANTLTLDPGAVRAAREARPAVVLAADLFGMSGDDEGLRRAADDLDAWYVVDAAQGFGATRGGRPTGYRADAVVLSFTTGKTLDAGEGGAVLTNRRDMYERLLWVSQHPYRQKRELGLHRVNEFAINGRLHPLVAARVLAELERVDARIAARRVETAALLRELIDCPSADIPKVPADLEPAWLRVTIRDRWQDVDAIAGWLEGHGIPVRPGPLPVNLLCEPGSCAVAEGEWRARVWLRETHAVHVSSSATHVSGRGLG